VSWNLTILPMQIHTHSWEMKNKEGLSPCEKTQLNADKWRHDRNFWISSLILLLWIVLHCFYEQADSHLRMLQQLEEAGIEPDIKRAAVVTSVADAATGAKQSVAEVVSAAVPDQMKGAKKQE
jgi:hypothetical protein